jgi:hypothetical protein
MSGEHEDRAHYQNEHLTCVETAQCNHSMIILTMWGTVPSL